MSQQLMKLYPDLYISVHTGKDGGDITVQVNRNGNDGEAIGEINLTSPDLHTLLSKWQDEALMAKRKGYFFCTGHVRHEKCHEGQYFHFAGNYCKEWGDQYPEERKAALNQNYD